MAKTIEQLKAQGAEVKNATVVGENTATRVGTLFTDIVEYIEQVTADGTVTTKKLAPLAVTTEKIANGAVTYDKLQPEIKEVVEDITYTENPEFISVKTDADGRLLWWIYPDGSIDWAKGVPTPIQEELKKLEQLIKDNTEGDESVVARVTANEASIAAINEVLSKKVDGEYVDNSEFVKVTTDSEDKVLEGIKSDGTKVIGGDLHVNGSAKVVGETEIGGVLYKVVESPEWLKAIVDAEDKVLAGIKINGTTYIANLEGLDDKLQEILTQFDQKIADTEAEIDAKIGIFEALFSIVENPEFISVELDTEGKVLGGRKIDGTKFENVGLDIGGTVLKGVNDPEDRMEVKTDSEQKVISYRKKDGTLVENVGIETNHLELTEIGMTDFQQALIDAGFNPKDKIDWSDSEFVEIPIPSVCAIINFGVNSQATSKSDSPDYNSGVNADIPTTIEYWDKNGNYFKKPILLSAQGSSSINYWIKNQAFDLDDGSKIKFGSWVAQDSFHVKKFYIDVFRGQSIIGYWLTEQVYQTREYGNRKPYEYTLGNTTSTSGIGKFANDFSNGALCHPDGFPVIVHFNGKSAGVYSFNLKKHRDNYACKKDSPRQIILDGNLGYGTIWGGTINWSQFEIRNPKGLKDINENAYDGDNPSELSDTDPLSAEVKQNIQRVANAYHAIMANKTKAKFEEYFNVPFYIDYVLISNVLWHQDGFGKNWIWCTWDGNVWCPTSYDMDSIFGSYFDGTKIIPAGDYVPLGQTPTAWTNTNSILGLSEYFGKYLWELYSDDIKARYKELRDSGVFSTSNIVSLLEIWVNKIGYDNLKNDIEKICAFNNIPQTPSYRDGNLTYEKYPNSGGCYNSILRVKKWLDEHFAYIDTMFEYNK